MIFSIIQSIMTRNTLQWLANQQQTFTDFIRIGIFVVMAWIGGLKAFQYEADGIVPFVINSPFMGFLYAKAGETAENSDGETVPSYTLHRNPEGKMVAANLEWHRENGTYVFSYGLGAVIVVIGLLVISGIWFPKSGLLGGMLTIGMSIVTLSFLVTTPETWVPNLGGDLPTPHHGFPYLSGAGRLVLKDIIMMGGGLVIVSDCARRILDKT